MISIVLEQTYGVPRPESRSRHTIPRRPLPSIYHRKNVKVRNAKDLIDDAPAAKKIWRQHVVRPKKHTEIGYDPVPGQQLTSKAARA